MKIFKSHFWYSKRQRNGILFLLLIIVSLQFIYFFVDFSSKRLVDVSQSEIIKFDKVIDSLRILEIEKRKPQKYLFNPNYITDFKGRKLGMSLTEIDRLHSFRKRNKFINSKEEFQKITKISDSLLNAISAYFNFPDWVVKRNMDRKNDLLNAKKNQLSLKDQSLIIVKYKRSTIDINKAIQQDFETIEGVGEVISKRIILFRAKLQGFSFKTQLNEVWGLDIVTCNRVNAVFKIVEKPLINRLNVNTITFKKLLKNPYIDYDLCKKVLEYRDEVAELQSISELKNIPEFPLDKYDRIILYLSAE